MKPVFNLFEPVKYFWKDLPLTDSKPQAQKVDLSDTYTLEKALAHFSKGLSFIERLEVLDKLQTLKKVNFEDYFSALNMRFDKNLHGKVLEKMKSWPNGFLTWAKEKDLNPKDFRIFLNEEGARLLKLLSIVVKLSPTKSRGLQILDLSLDLLATHKVTLEKLSEFTQDQKLLSFLNKKRFSKSLENDELLKEHFSKIELSKDSKLSVLREGDHNIIKLELKALSPEDLEKKMARMQTKMNEIKEAWRGESS